jgi:hypothetical protein
MRRNMITNNRHKTVLEANTTCLTGNADVGRLGETPL